MSKNWLKSPLKCSVSLLLTLGLLSVALGFSGSDQRTIEGSWIGTVTAVNPPLGSFANLITFIPKGGVIESRRSYADTPAGSLLETPGHGEWKKVGVKEYQVNYTFLLQGAPDNPKARGVALGTETISLRLRLNRQGTQLSGTFRSDAKDPNGNIVFTTTGTYSATRIEATP